MSNTDSEQRLVHKAAQGSRRAQAALFEQHWDECWRRAMAVLADSAAAEDAVHDAFEKAFARLSDFRGDAGFSTWIQRIVTNRCLDMLRQRSREESIPGDLSTVDPLPADSGPRSALRTAVAQLSPERRALVALVYWGDLTVAEAADALEIPTGTAKSRLSRALTQMRTYLETADE